MCLFFKVEDLISLGEEESVNQKQKVTFHVVMSVLVSCCSSLKETHFPFAIRVFSLLQKKIKKLESVITAVVRKAESPKSGMLSKATAWPISHSQTGNQRRDVEFVDTGWMKCETVLGRSDSQLGTPLLLQKV